MKNNLNKTINQLPLSNPNSSQTKCPTSPENNPFHIADPLFQAGVETFAYGEEAARHRGKNSNTVATKLRP